MDSGHIPVTQVGNVPVPLPASEGTFSGTIPSVLGSTVSLPVNYAVSIGLHVQPPTGGEVTFEGSWNGVEWEPVTLRQMGSHGYSSRSAEHENWIGSVATFVWFRIRVSVGGSAPGNYHGRFSSQFCTLEGIENTAMPHRIGAAVVTKDISVSSTSARELWTPAPGHKIVVTDINFTVSDNNAIVYISEGSIAQQRYIFRGKFKPPTGESVFVPISFAMPHVFQGTDSLFVTQTDSAVIEGVIHGYETEV